MMGSITVDVKDMSGIYLIPVQDTSVTSRKDTYVHFNVIIELQKHVKTLMKDAAVLNSDTSLRKGFLASSIFLSWGWIKLNV